MAQVNRVTNCNLYINGTTLAGMVEELTLPELKAKMSDHAALGSFGVSSYASGIEKLEGTVKWASFYKDAVIAAGNFITPVQLMVRYPVTKYTSGGAPITVQGVIFMTATFTSLPGGSFKKSDNVEISSGYAATSFKQMEDGETLVEFDALANIYKAGGVDLLADFRAAL